MPEYEVTITETLTKTVLIDAETVERAYEKVREKWHDSEYILGAEDFVEVEFGVNPARQEDREERNG